VKLRAALSAERVPDSRLVDVRVAWADAETAVLLCNLALEGYLDPARELQGFELRLLSSMGPRPAQVLDRCAVR
jgi:hypothetical protein